MQNTDFRRQCQGRGLFLVKCRENMELVHLRVYRAISSNNKANERTRKERPGHVYANGV